MAKNNNLRTAQKAKNDEFYTQLSDIENELKYYRQHFVGKTVYCNCDDARESNFFKFFSLNFEFLGLKKLISTGYKENGKGVKLIYTGDKNGNKMPDFDEIEVTELEGNGDFRSPECVELLKEADIVVTNPPFSLFREYVAQLMEYNKKFLIIGNGNAVTYKEIFPLIKENKLWIGYKSFSGGMDFIAGENYDASKCKHPKYDEKGNIIINVMMCVWFTNMEHDKRTMPLDLYMKYSNEYYKKYDNYDAIQVSKVCDIPMDFEGVMAVPITFLDKYCPNQFEILDLANTYLLFDIFGVNQKVKEQHSHCCNINGKATYARILIRHKR
jgi:hypothetical protein